MTSSERVLETLMHREPDRVPFDLSSTLVTGIHWKAYEKLRDHLGLPKQKVELFDLVQGLGRVHDDVLAALKVDTRGVLTGNPLGWKLGLEETPEYEQFTDVWGVTWRRPKPHGLYFDMVKHPLKGCTRICSPLLEPDRIPAVFLQRPHQRRVVFGLHGRVY
jgi:uroporphyrinogen decarboxylase